MNKEGYSSRRIAKILGCHHSTIARELKRCDTKYEAHLAERDKESKSSLKCRKTKATYEILDTIKKKLNSKWSPEQILGRLYKGILSFKTIYNWIYSGIIDFNISKSRTLLEETFCYFIEKKNEIPLYSGDMGKWYRKFEPSIICIQMQIHIQELILYFLV